MHSKDADEVTQCVDPSQTLTPGYSQFVHAYPSENLTCLWLDPPWFNLWFSLALARSVGI